MEAMPMRSFRTLYAVTAAVLLSFAVGCGGPMGAPDPAASPAAATRVYEFRGTVVSVDVGRRLIEVNHEEIPGFMPAMTMPYEVEDTRLLQGLAVGDRVTGTLRVDSRGYIITALAKA
jgi:protein SCO1/2